MFYQKPCIFDHIYKYYMIPDSDWLVYSSLEFMSLTTTTYGPLVFLNRIKKFGINIIHIFVKFDFNGRGA